MTTKEGGKPPVTENPPNKPSKLIIHQYNERLYNIFKLRQSLLTADSVLTWAYVLWILFAGVVGLLSLMNSERFPLRLDYCFAIATFFFYYATIGFLRRNSDSYLVTLCAHSDEEWSTSSLNKLFKDRKPYRVEDDPPLARKAYELRDKFGLPRRGLAQSSIVAWQFVAGLGYAVNYGYYVLWLGDLSAKTFSSNFWILNLTVTSGGLLILLKNSGFLISVKKLLETVSNVAGSLMGHKIRKSVEDKLED